MRVEFVWFVLWFFWTLFWTARYFYMKGYANGRNDALKFVFQVKDETDGTL